MQVLELDVAIERPAEQGAKAQRVLECLVGDETGTIIFSAINGQGERE